MARLPDGFNTLDLSDLLKGVKWSFKGCAIELKADLDNEGGSELINSWDNDVSSTIDERKFKQYRAVADLHRGFILRLESVEISTRQDFDFDFGDIIKQGGKRYYVDGWLSTSANGWYTYAAYEVLGDTYSNQDAVRFYYPIAAKNHSGKITQKVIGYIDQEIKQWTTYGDSWQYCYIQATAHKEGKEIAADSLGGVESNSEARYFRQVAKDLLSEIYGAI